MESVDDCVPLDGSMETENHKVFTIKIDRSLDNPAFYKTLIHEFIHAFDLVANGRFSLSEEKVLLLEDLVYQTYRTFRRSHEPKV